MLSDTEFSKYKYTAPFNQHAFQIELFVTVHMNLIVMPNGKLNFDGLALARNIAPLRPHSRL